MSVPIISGFGGKNLAGHMTCKLGIAADPIFGIPDPNLPIHYTTFMGQAMMKIKGSLLMSIHLIGGFGTKIWLGHVTCK